MLNLLAFLLTAFLTALNVALYAHDPSPWSLGAAVFIAFITVYNLVETVRHAGRR